MQKVIITIIALTMLLTTRSVFASIFVDYDEGTAASGDEAFVLRDLDFVDVERVEAGSGKKINIVAKTLNWIIKDRPTPLTGVDLFTVTTSAGQYPFIFKTNGDLALKNWTLTTNNATNTTPSLTFTNTQTLTSGFSDLTFDSASGSKLALRVPVTTSDQPELKFTSSTGGTSKIQFVHNGNEAHQIRVPDELILSGIEGLVNGVYLNADLLNVNATANLNISGTARVNVNDLILSGALKFPQNCIKTSGSVLQFLSSNCSDLVNVQVSNARVTNTPSSPNSVINREFTDAYVKVPTTGVYQQAFIDNFCEIDEGVVKCPRIWKYSTLNAHNPYGL